MKKRRRPDHSLSAGLTTTGLIAMVLSGVIAYLFQYEVVFLGTICSFFVGLAMFIVGILTEARHD